MKDFLQLSQTEMFFVFPHWYPAFKDDVINNYRRICEYNKREGIVSFDTVVDYSVEWLYRVCSSNEYGDRNYWEDNFVLEEYEAEANDFYDEAHGNHEHDFRDDLFAVMRDLRLSFYTFHGGYHNMPMKGVW